MLELKDVTYTYSSNHPFCLEGVNLTVELHQKVAVMGLNGSGKSTVLQLISGALEPTCGEVVFDGESLVNYAAKQRAQKLSFVPQRFPAVFAFTVYEFALMGRFAWQQGFGHSPADHKRTAEVLKEMGLWGLKDRLIDSLSGGEQQRLLLARAVIQDTPLVLLDEPTNHLDIKRKKEFFAAMNKQNQEHGKSIVAVLHDLEDVKTQFDMVLMLKDGKQAFFGPVSEALSDERVKDVFALH